MRLLDAAKFVHGEAAQEALVDVADPIPPYAIVSHTWGSNELTYKKFVKLHHHHQGHTGEPAFEKIKKSCLMTLQWGLEYVWMDTICIDQSSSAELSEAINSMFQWYQQSSLCLAYLSDVNAIEDDFMSDADPTPGLSPRRYSFHTARWFRRGWCLQELLAPRNMHFYNKNWEYIGSKYSLSKALETITSIPEYGLFIPDLSVLSVAQRMSWAAKRETSRPEDVAYCLLGLFNINMPLLYGEGQVKAFYRLQEEIMRRVEDHSIFAWSGEDVEGLDFGNDMIGGLSPNPTAFCKKVYLSKLPHRVEPLSITGRGIRAHLPLLSQWGSSTTYAAVIGCCESEDSDEFFAIPVMRIKKGSDIFRRSSPKLLIVPASRVKGAELETIFLMRQSNPTYLEDKDTNQVWFSQLEFRDCIYSIVGAFPLSRWNQGRRVFAFSITDFQGHPEMGVAFVSPNDRGFVLRMTIDMHESRVSCDLVAAESSMLRKMEHIDPGTAFERLLGLGTFHWADQNSGSESHLMLGSHRVTARLMRNTVFGQDLYEVKVKVKVEA